MGLYEHYGAWSIAGAVGAVVLVLAIVAALGLVFALAVAWALTALFGWPGVTWVSVLAIWVLLAVVGTVFKSKA
jgi:hypothetical protein